ncbi:hypothetical protein OD91_0834 [Lutibacter sp. Hel_I_33_5]|uniref:hypothetical protein n=1 Tax=Lutibacter sp. Hel_I_33_5 TaxID=1566289 RepID=UPI0011A0BFCE|nr:hypothetical protein [Lutibacter sp. Hel_I_33_5]TVZ55579.1 hypothetical protein OD91_0834 [Lutibacter sp. Hel_I_33_5]
MKKIIILITLFISSIGISQEIIPTKKTQKGFAALDFLSIDMPSNTIFPNEANMSFTGIHYNLKLSDFYTGIGIYGSVTGKRGGFFTLGVNAGYKKLLSKKIFLDTGFHFGGGGGAGAPDGGGAFILPHFNIGYQFEKFSITSGWSYVNFFDGGDIKSHQLNVALQIPFDFDYTNNKFTEREYSLGALKKTDWNKKPNRLSLMMHLNNLSINGKQKLTDGTSLNGKTIRLAGFELISYLNDNWFTFLRADGAYHGIKAGYMDIFFGGGYHLSFNKNRTNIQAKFGIGAGGGGGVDTKGGFLIYPDISIEQKLFNNIYVSLNKGYLMTPDSHFYTSTFGAGIKYYMNTNGVKTNGVKTNGVKTNGVKTNDNSYSNAKFKGFETILKHDIYFHADRQTNPIENLHQISFQMNFPISKNIYLAGQTSFANFGNAGAYAEGIVGFGVKSNSFLNKKVNLFAQVLTGAAGGGNISTGQGLIVKPSIGTYYKLNDQLSLRGSLGYVKARGGKLSSPLINFGISYHFTYLKL